MNPLFFALVIAKKYKIYIYAKNRTIQSNERGMITILPSVSTTSKSKIYEAKG